jgi:hypothetical protein
LRHYHRNAGFNEQPISSPDFARLDFVDITPNPRFPRLNRADQRVLRFMKMFRGVLVFRRVATAHLSTNEAHAQVNPRVAKFYALLADMLIRLCEFDFFQVRAFCRHRFLLEVS